MAILKKLADQDYVIEKITEIVTSNPDLKGEKGDAFTYDDFTEEQLTKLKGDSGLTPHIGENGNWWIGETDTGVNAGGYTPEKGTDYWTDADKAEIKSYVDEAILGGAW